MTATLEQANAKISDYQNNGPLNALVHVLAKKMGDIYEGSDAERKKAIAELSDTFNNVWPLEGIYLAWDEIKDILAEMDPMHQEMLLGPVLREMLPNAEARGVEIAPKSVATLAKRFGIRLESYETVEGALSRIKEELRSSEQPLPADASFMQQQMREEFLQRKASEKYQKDLADNGKKSLAEIQDIMKNPGNRNGLEDCIKEGDGTDRQAADTHCVATLRVVREKSAYRFEAFNKNETTDRSRIFEPVLHNTKSYQTPRDDRQTVSQLKKSLQDAVTAAHADCAAISEGDKKAAMTAALKHQSSTFFKKYEDDLVKASKSGGDDSSKGLFGGMMDAMQGNIDSFLDSKDIFGSFKGLAGLFKTLLGPIMEMFMGFQETIAEFSKRPGDPLSKKELEAGSQEEQAAAREFSLRVAALDENSSASKLLNAKWREQPDSTDVWADLVDALFTEEDYKAADACLRAQEAKMLKTLKALEKDLANAEGKQKNTTKKRKITAEKEKIQALIAQYESGDLSELESPDLRAEPESVKARLDVFRDLHSGTQELAKTERMLKDAATKKEHAVAQKVVLQKQVNELGSVVSPLLAERLKQVEKELKILDDKSDERGIEKITKNREDARILKFDTFPKKTTIQDQITERKCRATI